MIRRSKMRKGTTHSGNQQSHGWRQLLGKEGDTNIKVVQAEKKQSAEEHEVSKPIMIQDSSTSENKEHVKGVEHEHVHNKPLGDPPDGQQKKQIAAPESQRQQSDNSAATVETEISALADS
ncbi:hypothetical protein K7X08_038018 [Anisodus acutangulus]|uniref:Uncharacterized protein n=1 Tax=Anisodus acutangulus TaxID=402998 RepID=A0A9Q1RSK6_9SOLA|nr:hypothetical protein K7X08_038018 [Anisodus acutangulus]